MKLSELLNCTLDIEINGIINNVIGFNKLIILAVKKNSKSSIIIFKVFLIIKFFCVIIFFILFHPFFYKI